MRAMRMMTRAIDTHIEQLVMRSAAHAHESTLMYTCTHTNTHTSTPTNAPKTHLIDIKMWRHGTLPRPVVS